MKLIEWRHRYHRGKYQPTLRQCHSFSHLFFTQQYNITTCILCCKMLLLMSVYWNVTLDVWTERWSYVKTKSLASTKMKQCDGNSFECSRDINSLERRSRYCANGHAKNHLSPPSGLGDEGEVINLQIIIPSISIVLRISANRKVFLALDVRARKKQNCSFLAEASLSLTSLPLLS